MKCIVDVEGLKAEVDEMPIESPSWRELLSTIDAHTIEMPDLVDREEIIPAFGETNTFQIGEIIDIIAAIPAWTGKE